MTQENAASLHLNAALSELAVESGRYVARTLPQRELRRAATQQSRLSAPSCRATGRTAATRGGLRRSRPPSSRDISSSSLTDARSLEEHKRHPRRRSSPMPRRAAGGTRWHRRKSDCRRRRPRKRPLRLPFKGGDAIKVTAGSLPTSSVNLSSSMTTAGCAYFLEILGGRVRCSCRETCRAGARRRLNCQLGRFLRVLSSTASR